MLLKLDLDGSEVHRLLDHLVVIQYTQLFSVDRGREDPRSWVATQGHHQARRCLLPLVVNGGAFRHFRQLQLLDRRGVFTIFGLLKILRQVRVLFFEFVELSVAQGFVVTAFPERGEEVPARDLALVDLLLGRQGFLNYLLCGVGSGGFVLLAVVDGRAAIFEN